MDRDSEKLIGALVGFAFVMALIWLMLVAAVVVLASIALFIVGWYVTHILVRIVDTAFEGQVVADHGGLLLVLAGLFWALVTWVLIPNVWLHWLTSLLPSIANVAYLSPLVGAILGLAWGVLVLFFSDGEEETDSLNAAGMVSFTEQQLLSMETDTADIVSQGIILGVDLDD